MKFDVEIPAGKQFDAVALGLNAVDHLIVVPHFPKFDTKIPFISHTIAPGGQCATAMVTLARLGMRTSYIGKVGSDEAGRFQIESIRSEGVECSGIDVVEKAESQTAFIIVDKKSGERTILWKRDHRLTTSADEVSREAVTCGRVLHLDGHDVAASIVAARYAREAGVPTVLDIDNAYPGYEQLLPLIDFIICSSTFTERVTRERDLSTGLRALQELSGSKFVAATTGRAGAYGLYKGKILQSPGFAIKCKDTTGAGDAFHGGFIYGLLKGLNVEETLSFANAVAGLNCRGVGARTSLPRLDEVRALLEDQPSKRKG
jgi:sulfofructose kinase